MVVALLNLHLLTDVRKKVYCLYFDLKQLIAACMVGKGVHTPIFLGQLSSPFSKMIPFLEIQDVLPFIGLSGKQKY